MNSCAKGKRGERGWRDELRAQGYEARRGQQFAGGAESPDVICEALPFHFEVKHTERLRIYDAMAQAVRDSAGVKAPVVAHRRNHSGWLVVMRAEDWFDLIRELLPAKADGLKEAA